MIPWSCDRLTNRKKKASFYLRYFSPCRIPCVTCGKVVLLCFTQLVSCYVIVNKFVRHGEHFPGFSFCICLCFFDFILLNVVTCNYRISSNKHRVSNKHRPLISAAPLSIHIEISASL